MTEQIENLKKLLKKLRELGNLDKLTGRVDKTMKGLHDQKINLLRQIEEKFVHYNNFRNLRQEESEERKLLQALERIVLREKRYVEFLMKILARFEKDFKEIRNSLYSAYHLDHSSLQSPYSQLMGSIQNLLFYNLYYILRSTKERIEKELSFISKWVGGTGPLSFFRQKNVLNNFKGELEGLYALYKENEEYVRSQLQKIPALQRDIQIKTTYWIAYIRKQRAYEKRPREREEYSSTVDSLGRESSTFGGNLARGVAYGLLGYAAGAAIGQAIRRF